jgi:hypothetical protein
MKPKKFNVKKKIQAPAGEHNKNYVLQPHFLTFCCVWSPYPYMVGYGRLDTTDLADYGQIWECWH